MKQRRVTSWWTQWTCVGGTCAPPAAPPRTSLERLLDTYTRFTAPFLRGCYALVLVVAVALTSFWLGASAGLWLVAGYIAAYAAYCLANFARCREAHCVVTGAGWAAVALAAAAGAVTGRPTLSEVWLAFALIALLGHGFEAIWRSARGTNALPF